MERWPQIVRGAVRGLVVHRAAEWAGGIGFMGARDAALAAGMPLVYLAGTAVLLTLAYVGRAHQVRT